MHDATSADPKKFTFDEVFDPTRSQLDIFNYGVKSVIDKCLDGYNGTIFAYGQSGSGKTFTIEGKDDEPGLRQHSFAYIFKALEARKANIEISSFAVSMSYLQIYREQAYDLIGGDENRKLRIIGDTNGQNGFIAQGLAVRDVEVSRPLLNVCLIPVMARWPTLPRIWLGIWLSIFSRGAEGGEGGGVKSWALQ